MGKIGKHVTQTRVEESLTNATVCDKDGGGVKSREIHVT